MAIVKGLVKKIELLLNPKDQNGIRKYTSVGINNDKLSGKTKKGDRKIKINKQTYIVAPSTEDQWSDKYLATYEFTDDVIKKFIKLFNDHEFQVLYHESVEHDCSCIGVAFSHTFYLKDIKNDL